MDSGFLLTSGGTALISSLIIQALKNSELSIFNFLGKDATKSKANLIFSIVVAFITSIGIGFKYDAAAGTILLSGITAAGIQHGLWHWFVQWIGQHVTYKAFVVPTELQAANVNLLKALLTQMENSNVPTSSTNTSTAKS